MILSLKEIEILQALNAQYPKPSSVKQLVEVTKRERSIVKDILAGLKTLTLVSVSDKNEVNLLKTGKKYLGIDCTDIKPFVKSDVSIGVAVFAPLKIASTASIKDTPGNKASIDISLDELEIKLNPIAFNVEELDLKLNVLKRLSALLSDDIGKVLLSISDDLTVIDTPKEAA